MHDRQSAGASVPYIPLVDTDGHVSPQTNVNSPMAAAGGGSPVRIPCGHGDLCRKHKFYDKYPLKGATPDTLARLFCDLQALVEDRFEDLQAALARMDTTGIGDEEWNATYEHTFGEGSTETRVATTIHAMHLAASLGSIPLMEWIMLRLGRGILNTKAMMVKWVNTTKTGPDEHYTPLMSALFMSRVEAVLWLLNNNADPTAANNDGMTALHLLAMYGMPLVRPESRWQAMQTVAAKLVERGANIAAPSGPLPFRTDPEAEFERNKRPLEIAALKQRAYPKQMLHLLTSSYQCPEKSELFEEVHIIAKANPSGAETLMENVRANVTGQLKEKLILEIYDFKLGRRIPNCASGPAKLDWMREWLRFLEDRERKRNGLPPLRFDWVPWRLRCLEDARREREGLEPLDPVEDWAWLSKWERSLRRIKVVEGGVERFMKYFFPKGKDGNHVDMLVTILRMSPVAGAELLKLLMIEPKVRDPHRYPLPLFTTLPNRVMCCTYQNVNDWNRGDTQQPAPAWHSLFRQDLPVDPLRHDRVYEVKVRVLNFPGILNLRVLTILSRVWYYGHHMRIFAQLPVQAIVHTMWVRSWPTFWFLMIRELALLLVLVLLGMCPPPEDYALVQRLARTIVLSELISEGWSLLSGLASCSTLAGMPWKTYFFTFHLHGFLQLIALSLFTQVDFPIQTPEEKVVVAVNILMTCFILISRLRTVPELGPLIIAVLRSFAPMQWMFVLMTCVFIPFFFAFATIKDDNRDLWYVGLYLYRSLFLNDGDATEALSGFDYGREQILDFGREQFTGGQSRLIVNSSTVFMVIATLLFSIVLLNLVIGMYSEFYDEMRPFAELLFHQQRAKACVAYMLSSGWLHFFVGDTLIQYSSVLFRIAGLCLLFCVVTLFFPTELFLLLRLIPWTVAVQLCQAALVSRISDTAERNNFLWVSYRSDYSDEYYMEHTNQELIKLRRQLARAEANTQAELEKLRRLLETNQPWNRGANSPGGLYF